MISVSDFVEILVECYSDAVQGSIGGPVPNANPDPQECDAFVQNQLQRPLSYWRERTIFLLVFTFMVSRLSLGLKSLPHLVFVTPEDSVLECVYVMLQQVNL